MTTTDQPDLILSHLILAVMGLRNKYKYDTVAPKALHDEIDVAYNEALAKLEAVIAAERQNYEAMFQQLINCHGYEKAKAIKEGIEAKSLTPQAKAGQA